MLAKLRSPLVCAIVSLAICTVSRLAAETFSNPLRIPTPVDPTSVLVGDLNGDGRPDIVWGDTSTSPFVLHVLLAQPGGGFLPAPAPPFFSAALVSPSARPCTMRRPSARMPSLNTAPWSLT